MRSYRSERKSCPVCFGLLARVVEGEETGQHEEWTICTGKCKKRFAPPWREPQWDEPQSRPIPNELCVESIRSTAA